MRRVILAILGLLFSTGFCMAQRPPLIQRGMATVENTEEGLTARHPSLPVGSVARVTNLTNGKEIEVTISINRIAPSPARVIDLSPAAALALDIGKGGLVQISEIRRARPEPPPPPPPPEPESAPPLTQRGIPTQEIQRQPLIQLGMATQENTDEGLTIHHPTLPIGSKAKVTNIANGKEIEVIIVSPRIPASATRVIDLSPSAALALDIGKGGPVIIKELPPQQR